MNARNEQSVVMFVNDSYFSALIARPVVKMLGVQISSAVFSSRTTSSPRRIWRIFRKTHWRYFVYRSLVDAVSRANRIRAKGTVRGIVGMHGIRVVDAADATAAYRAGEVPGGSLGIAVNFDQVIGADLLKAYRYGVLNLHASRLPEDKGISPALWAFARGETKLWATIYRMSGQLDCGQVFAQFEIPVLPGDTGFSVYARLCSIGGERLARVAADLLGGVATIIDESRESEGTYNSWPDDRHATMLAGCRRRLWRWRDFTKALLCSAR